MTMMHLYLYLIGQSIGQKKKEKLEKNISLFYKPTKVSSFPPFQRNSQKYRLSVQVVFFYKHASLITTTTTNQTIQQ